MNEDKLARLLNDLASPVDDTGDLAEIRRRATSQRPRRSILRLAAGGAMVVLLAVLLYGGWQVLRPEPRLVITDEVSPGVTLENDGGPENQTTSPGGDTEEGGTDQGVTDPAAAGWRIYPPTPLPQLAPEGQRPGLSAFDGEFLLTQYVAPLESGLGAGFVMYRIVEESGELRIEARSFAGTFAALVGGMEAGRAVWSSTGDAQNPDSPEAAVEVYLYEWTTDESRPLTSNDRVDGDARISEDFAVWNEGVARALTGFGGEDGGVVVHDFRSGESRALSNTGSNTAPSLSGSRLVWQRRLSAGWEVWYRDLATDQEERLAGPFQADWPPSPQIGDRSVVWMEGEGQERRVMLSELAQDGPTVPRAIPFPGVIQSADVTGHLVVGYGSSDSEGVGLFLYDLDRERLFPLTDDPQFLPPLEDVAFGEELVAWGAPQGSEWVIKAYDGRTGTAVTLARMELTPGSVVAPQSANRRVAWLSSTGELELREAP
jgi:hypothetical protein